MNVFVEQVLWEKAPTAACCFYVFARSDEDEDCFARLLSKQKSQLISSTNTPVHRQNTPANYMPRAKMISLYYQRASSWLDYQENDLFNRICLIRGILKNGTPKARAAGMTASLTWPLRPSRPQKLESSWVQRGKEEGTRNEGRRRPKKRQHNPKKKSIHSKKFWYRKMNQTWKVFSVNNRKRGKKSIEVLWNEWYVPWEELKR